MFEKVRKACHRLVLILGADVVEQINGNQWCGGVRMDQQGQTVVKCVFMVFYYHAGVARLILFSGQLQT
jgi:hypothetical protein